MTKKVTIALKKKLLKKFKYLAKTASILEGSAKVTNPKPRDRLVPLFFMTTQSITSPNWEK